MSGQPRSNQLATPVPRALGPVRFLLTLGVITCLLMAIVDGDLLEVLLTVAAGLALLYWTWQWQRDWGATSAVERRRSLIGNSVIIPRQDAFTEELKQLGTIIQIWWEQHRDGAKCSQQWIDQAAIEDLQAGELPQPLALRLLSTSGREIPATGRRASTNLANRFKSNLQSALKQAGESDPRINGVLSRHISRAVHFHLDITDRAEKQRLLARLRATIPAELVDDIFIDGTSWNSEG